MTKNKNRKEQAMLEEMAQSDIQIVLLREDGMEQPMEAQAEKNKVLKLGQTIQVIQMDKTGLVDVESSIIDDSFADDFHKRLCLEMNSD